MTAKVEFYAIILLERAEKAFRLGNSILAKNLLNTMLTHTPHHPRANELMGYIAGNAGNYSEAIDYFRTALTGSASNHTIRYYLGVALQHAGAHVDALHEFETTLEKGCEYFEVLHDLGVSLSALGNFEQAIVIFTRAIQINPQSFLAYYNRGRAHGSLLHQQSELEDYTKSITLNPEYADTYTNRGVVLHELKRYHEALSDFNKAIQLNPTNAEAYNNRGNTLQELNCFENALIDHNKAIEIKSDYVDAYYNRGVALNFLKHYQEALSDYQQAIALNPSHAHAHYNVGICRLLIGDFAEGWSKYAWRWKLGKYGELPSINAPLWKREYIDGSILAVGEQGLGDEILHMSTIPELKPYAKQLVLAIEPRLMALAQRSFPDVHVIRKNELPSADQFAAWLPLGDLGGHFRKSWEDFSHAQYPYLKADPGLSARLRETLTRKNHVVCGLSWVSKNKDFGSHKSFRLQDMLTILKIPGIAFVDLQYGDTLQERQELEASTQIHITRLEEIDNTNDIDGLAALIQACDIVVTISNTTAHLAGALGKPVLLMLPYSQGLIWYWHENRGDNPWYPSIKIFRQPTQSDWNTVISQVAQEIRTRFVKHDN